eukprot:scaffold6021_cov117-Isochrysis_galbana.AAC.16
MTGMATYENFFHLSVSAANRQVGRCVHIRMVLSGAQCRFATWEDKPRAPLACSMSWLIWRIVARNTGCFAAADRRERKPAENMTRAGRAPVAAPAALLYQVGCKPVKKLFFSSRRQKQNSSSYPPRVQGEEQGQTRACTPDSSRLRYTGAPNRE